MSKPFRPGEPVSAKKLNSHSAALAQDGLAGAPGSLTRFGSATSMVVHDLVNTGIVCRMTEQLLEQNSKDGTRDIYKYSWEALQFNEYTENWYRDTTRFGHKSVDPVYSLSLGPLIVTDDNAFNTAIPWDQRKSLYPISPYLLFKDPVSQKLFAVETQAGGELQTKAQDIVLMILGDYATYKDCPGVYQVVSDPPKVNNLLCEPAYAWSAYKVCGYKFKKLFTMKDYKKWAIELNGGTASGLRRFYQSIWGWNEYTDGPPMQNANTTCSGVRFLGYSSQGDLTCTCPTWLSDVQCLKIEVKFVPQITCPDPPPAGCECDKPFWNKMASLWGTTQTFTLCKESGGGCQWAGDISVNGSLFIGFLFTWQNMPPDSDKDGNCSWGPDEFDPCNPCDGFSRMGMSVNISTVNGGSPGNLYSWYWQTIQAIRTLVNGCPGSDPVTLNLGAKLDQSPCPNVIEWIKLSCCNQTQINDCVAAQNP